MTQKEVGEQLELCEKVSTFGDYCKTATSACAKYPALLKQLDEAMVKLRDKCLGYTNGCTCRTCHWVRPYFGGAR